MSLKLAAFADEISPDLNLQIEHCRRNGVTHIELRRVAGKGVLDFDKALRHEIKQKLADNGLAVACIGSPIGKVKLHEPFAAHFERFKIAVELAEFFDAPMIRVFSYFPAANTTHADLITSGRAEVLRRFEQKLAYLAPFRPMLVHENEARIFGESVAQCVDLLQTLNSPRLRAAFDFANFVQAGEDPLANWPLLKPFTTHIHIKDAQRGTGTVVPSGQGDGHIGDILRDAVASGYRGFLSLEPHLAAAGEFNGFSGPDLFKVAVDALRQVCRDNRVPLAS
jgi:sugar phosphate isomerase/epimerase